MSEEIGLCVFLVTSNKTFAAVVNGGYRPIFLCSLGLICKLYTLKIVSFDCISAPFSFPLPSFPFETQYSGSNLRKLIASMDSPFVATL